MLPQANRPDLPRLDRDVDYGAAQRIYARRGYLPDGRGIMDRNQPVEWGAVVRVDDDAALMLTRPATRADA